MGFQGLCCCETGTMGNVSQMHRNQCECNRVCPSAAQHGLASGPLAEKWGPGNSRPHWSQVFLDRQDRTEWAEQALLPAWALFIFISALASSAMQFLQRLHSLEWAESRTHKAQGLFICSFYWEKRMVFNRKKQMGKKKSSHRDC